MQSTKEFETIINNIYDHLYAGSHFKTPASISRELGKLLYLLRYAENKGTRSSIDLELLHSVSSGSLRDPEAIRAIAELCRDAFTLMKEDSDLFKDAEIGFSDFDIVYCLSQLADVDISSSSKDVVGDALEAIRSQWTKRAGGQFFTDQLVTRLAMHLLEFDPNKGHTLIDACAGTGGFLLAAIERARMLNPDLEDKALSDLLERAISGQEIDSEIAEIANATLESRMPYLSSRLVHNGDSLQTSKSGKVAYEYYTHAATNPPFGSKITIKDPEILKNYELARKGSAESSAQFIHRAPDVLFMEQNIKMVKPGTGKIAIVTPYQQLSGPQARYVREWILKHAKIIAVIDLPPDTFQPHTGTKASLLVLQRRDKPLGSVDDIDNEATFYAVPKWIGHDRRGNPVYAKNPDGSDSGEILTDFNEVAEAFDAFKAGDDPSGIHPESFVVSSNAIISDNNLRLNGRFHQIAQKANKKTSGALSRAGWKKVTLGECSKSIFCPGRFKRNYVSPGHETVPFFGGTNISQLHAETTKHMSINDLRYENLAVKAGWILITRSGSCGVVSTVTPEWDGIAISEHVIRVVVADNSPVPAEYLQLFLRSEAGQNALASGVFGSVIDEITPEHIAQITIPVPPKEILDKLVRKVARSEKGRDEACKNMNAALHEINGLL